MSLQSLRSVRQLAAEVPAFSQASIRWAIFNAHQNGLAPALVRLGKRVLIDRDAFERWVYSHRQDADAGPAPAALAARQRRRQ
jgi:hypothetical protein